MCYLNNIGGSFCKARQILFWGEGRQNMAVWEIKSINVSKHMAFIFKCYHHMAVHVQECTCILFVNILVMVMFFWNVQCNDAESVYCLPLSENLQHIQNLLWRLLKSLSCTFCFIFTLDDNKRMELIQKTCCLPASYHWLVYTYCHLMVRCTSICHMLSNVYIPFPVLPHFWPKESCWLREWPL
jgi:hypothetical protein